MMRPLFGLFLLASALVLLPSPATAQAAPAKADKANDRIVTITLGGDTGFSPGGGAVDPRGSSKYGRWLTFAEAFDPIAKELNGELNFVNVETVVTDRNDLPADTKGQSRPFNFRSHPNGIAYLVQRGVNLFSLANNHSMDFGEAGLRETLHHVAAMAPKGLKAWAGIGLNRDEASRPKLVKVKGAEFAFSAIGIVTNNLARHRAGPNKPGQIAYRFDDDLALVLDRLKAAPAEYRILSIHYGIEGQVRADADQTTKWRQAARDDGIDLIVGHHAHVARGVEINDGKVIFYGLGNFLHHGTANMTGAGICRSYGLLARVHVLKGDDGRWRARAVEAIPVTDTHVAPRRFASAADAHARVFALNYLAELLDDKAVGARGMRFTPRPDGSGLYCADGAARDGGRISALCRSWQPAPPIPQGLRGQIAVSCAK